MNGLTIRASKQSRAAAATTTSRSTPSARPRCTRGGSCQSGACVGLPSLLVQGLGGRATPAASGTATRRGVANARSRGTGCHRAAAGSAGGSQVGFPFLPQKSMATRDEMKIEIPRWKKLRVQCEKAPWRRRRAGRWRHRQMRA